VWQRAFPLAKWNGVRLTIDGPSVTRCGTSAALSVTCTRKQSTGVHRHIRDAVIAYLNRCHVESMELFRALTPDQWDGKTTTAAGTAITTWKWLRAMVEHEAHHRGQIYLMLGMMGVSAPPLYGLTEEDVAARSARR
jgi:uncharacterized damage-inducible protein DinB